MVIFCLTHRWHVHQEDVWDTVSANITIIQRTSSNGQFPDAQMAPHVRKLHNITYFQQRPWKLDLVHQLTIWMLHITQHTRHICETDSGRSIEQQCCLLFDGNKPEENIWKRGGKPILLGLTVGVLGSFEFWENLRSSWWISVPSPWSKKPWDELVTSDRGKVRTQYINCFLPCVDVSIFINLYQYHPTRMQYGVEEKGSKDNATIICQKNIYIATDLVVDMIYWHYKSFLANKNSVVFCQLQFSLYF